MDTGYTKQKIRQIMNRSYHAGLERVHFHTDHDSPYFVKRTVQVAKIGDVLMSDTVVLDSVIIPIRNMDAMTQSRMDMRDAINDERRKSGRPLRVWSKNHKVVKIGLQDEMSRMMVALSRFNVPVIFVHYPTLILDGAYLYDKMRPVLRGVKKEVFLRAHRRIARPEFVHQYNEDDR